MFYFLRNLLAVLGLVVIIAAGYAMVKFQPSLTADGGFEDNALGVFADVGVKLIETGNMAEASIWKVCIRPVPTNLRPYIWSSRLSTFKL